MSMPTPPDEALPWPEEWSPWEPLSNLQSAEPKRGVYRIRCRDGNRVQMIARANGLDGNGIVYVGRSANVRTRLFQFYENARSPQAQYPNIAGLNYRDRGYSRRFPLSELEFCYVLRSTADQAANTEAAVIRQYLDQFLDLPPLNFSVPRRVVDRSGTTVEDEMRGDEDDEGLMQAQGEDGDRKATQDRGVVEQETCDASDDQSECPPSDEATNTPSLADSEVTSTDGPSSLATPRM